MREILFRGKALKNNEWVYGFYHNETSKESPSSDRKVTRHHIYTQGFDLFVDPETIGQYTGLTDKNGTKIFEGDIVRILYTDWTSKSENDTRTLDEYLRDIAKIGVVEWDRYYPQFHIHFMDKDNYNSLNYGRYGFIEVIGNIYDNPEILEI